MGSKDTSWEELAWESPCSGILSSTKFSLNSCSHPEFQNITGLTVHSTTCLSVLSVVLFWILDFYWLGQYRVSPISHQPYLTQSLERCHFQFDPLVLESWYYLLSVMKTSLKKMLSNDSLSWKCPWSWWVRSWRRSWQAWSHNRNEVLRVALYPNPVL